MLRRILSGGIFLLFFVFSATEESPPFSQFLSAESLLKAGEFALQKGEYAEALSLLQRAHTASLNENNPACTISSLLKLGLVYWNMGKLPECKISFENARMIASQANGTAEFCQISLEIIHLYENGRSSRSENKLDESIRYFSEAIELARTIKNRAFEQKCFRQLGGTYWEKSDFESFYLHNKTALNIALEIHCRREEGICLNNIGLYLLKNCNYAEAYKIFDAAIQIYHKIDEPRLLNDCLSNKNLIYIEIGEYEKAKDILEEIIRNDIRISNNEENVAVDLSNLGIIEKKLGCLIENDGLILLSIEHYKQAISIGKHIKNKTIQARALINLGEAFYVINREAEALRCYNQARAVASLSGNFEVIINAYIGIGRIYRKTNRNNEAIQLFKKAVDLSRNKNVIGDQWEAYFNLGISFEEAGLYERACLEYENSIKCIDFIQNQNRGDSIKIGILRNKRIVYERIIHLYQEGLLKRAIDMISEVSFMYAERAKARVFLENILERPGKPFGHREGKNQIGFLGYFLNYSKNRMIMNRAGNEDRKSSSVGLSEVDKYSDMYNEYSLKKNSGEEIKYSSTSGSSVIRSDLLNAETVLLEYVLSEPRSYLFILDVESCRVFKLPSRSALEKSIKGYAKFLSQAIRQNQYGHQAARRIYHEILFPLEEIQYQKKTQLIIIPDGILNYLPFEALIVKNNLGNDVYLVEKYQISYTPSANILRCLIKRNRGKQFGDGLLVLGDPANKKNATSLSVPNPSILYEELFDNFKDRLPALPFSREEVDYAAAQFPARKVMKFLGAEASEARMKNVRGRYFDIIHLSCHGLIDEVCPLQSSLALASNPLDGEDGFLQAREICEISLNANLVILSACQTARGTIEESEGIMGLPRAFFYAGASSVLSTLWPINDRSTTIFMKLYYDFLKRGLSKSWALQRTKIRMIRNGFPNPYDWAPFILYGDPASSIEFDN